MWGEDFDTGYWEFISSSLCSVYQSSNTYEGRAWYRLALPCTLQLRKDGSLK